MPPRAPLSPLAPTSAELRELLAPYLKQKGIARLEDPDVASGLCKETSFRLAAWLSERGVAASVLNLAEPKGFEFSRLQRFWQGSNLPYAIHYAVRVSDIAVDLTARQFDSAAAFPEICTLAELQSRWGVAYDLAEPLRAGPLWHS